MKILIVNFSDIEGGASRAANRLHKALLEAGVTSRMLVQSKSSDDFTVTGPETKIGKASAAIRPFLDSIPTKFYSNRTKTAFSPSWIPFCGLVDKINAFHPDIVHLHWVGEGMLHIKEIAKIKAPIVWSLHDMMPFTGGCHYDEDCEGYRKSCGTCRVLGSNKNVDLSRSVFNIKAETYRKINNLTVIGLSKWLEKCAAESTLFKGRKVVNLPNPLDTQIFSAVDKISARDIFNLPRDKKLVLFGAINTTSDPRKGFKELCEALTHIKGNDIELVVFGSSPPMTPQNFQFKTHYLGRLHDDASLKVLYSAADVMVVPSLQENLSNAIMESLSCSTPVVAFEIGGNSDMIEHQINGYLAKPFDTVDLAAGINWILSSSNHTELSQNARKKVAESFDSKIVIQKYIRLYKEILQCEY